MPHEIYEIGDDHSMAYAGEVPWHGFGQKLHSMKRGRKAPLFNGRRSHEKGL